jgi:hypothetical protein
MTRPHPWPRRAAAIGVVVAAALAVVTPDAARADDPAAERAAAEIAAVQRQADKAAATMATLGQDLADLRDELRTLDERRAALSGKLDGLSGALRKVALERYVSGTSDLTSAIGYSLGGDPTTPPSRRTWVSSSPGAAPRNSTSTEPPATTSLERTSSCGPGRRRPSANASAWKCRGVTSNANGRPTGRRGQAQGRRRRPGCPRPPQGRRDRRHLDHDNRGGTPNRRRPCPTAGRYTSRAEQPDTDASAVATLDSDARNVPHACTGADWWGRLGPPSQRTDSVR